MSKKHRLLMLSFAALLFAGASAPAFADDDDDDDDDDRTGHRWHEDSHEGGEYKEKYRDGPCKVERELKRDGSYKEERECKGSEAGPYRHPDGEYEEKYVDGPCKVEREWKRDGTYKEKLDCKGYAPPPRQRDRHVSVIAPPWLVYGSAGPAYRPGWEPSAPAADQSGAFFRCHRMEIGAALGGVAGAVLGSQIGDGRTAATIGGAIAGLLVGGAVGRSMDAQDQACIGQALEFAEPGRSVTWQDEQARTRYAVTPGRIEQGADGRYCRPYVADVVIDGRREQVQGTACRERNGVWKNLLPGV